MAGEDHGSGPRKYMKTGQDLRRLTVPALLAVAATDTVARMRIWPRPVAAVLDETAHLGTGILVLSAFQRPPPGFRAGLLAASVLLDVDHVPDVLGSRMLRPRGQRPRPHSVATLLVLASSPQLDG